MSHPEAAVDPLIAVPDWGLSARGVARAIALAARWPFGVAALWASPERKAQDCAAILDAVLGQGANTLHHSGEVDRSSTGFVPFARHEALADRLFGHPSDSADGWARAVDAQTRIVAAADQALKAATGNVVLVGHGAVGSLLFCALTGQAISRRFDQPRQGCGWCYDLVQGRALHGWLPFEAL